MTFEAALLEVVGEYTAMWVGYTLKLLAYLYILKIWVELLRRDSS